MVKKSATKKSTGGADSVEITFTESVRVYDHNGEIEFEANEGQSGKINRKSADRWIKRGKAVEGKVKIEQDKAKSAADDENSEKAGG